jgi:serine/threonine-protein phosphatase 6 catalytic subunit
MEQAWLIKLLKGELLPENDLFNLCEKAKEILLEENNV